MRLSSWHLFLSSFRTWIMEEVRNDNDPSHMGKVCYFLISHIQSDCFCEVRWSCFLNIEAVVGLMQRLLPSHRK
jgi:hypothetical protein